MEKSPEDRASYTKNLRKVLTENNKILDEILSSLQTKEVDLNLYVDANHLKISIKQALPDIQKHCQKVWNYFNKGQFPTLKLDKHAYGHLSASVLVQFLKAFDRKYELLVPGKNIEKSILEGHLVNKRSLHRLFKTGPLDEKYSLEAVHDKFNEQFGHSLSDAIHYQCNFYVNFFLGDKPDLSVIDDLLKKNILSLQDANDLLLRKTKEQGPYIQFRAALKDFENYFVSQDSMISEMQLGVTKYSFDRQKIDLKFNEKMVDTKLVIAALDDFHIANENTAFAIFTNDTDYQPLFERIRTKYPLFWINGDYKNKGGKELIATVDKKNIFNAKEALIFSTEPSACFPSINIPDEYWELRRDYSYEMSRHG